MVYKLFIIICLTEILTQVIIKGEIFLSIRTFFIEKNIIFLNKLLTCGYCFSFWVSFGISFIFYYTDNLPIILSNNVINFLSVWLLSQRGSNILHGCIDKYFDKKYDIRYNDRGII